MSNTNIIDLIKQWNWNIDSLINILSVALVNYKSLKDHTPEFIKNNLNNPIVPTFSDYDGYYFPVFKIEHPFKYNNFSNKIDLSLVPVMMLMLNLEEKENYIYNEWNDWNDWNEYSYLNNSKIFENLYNAYLDEIKQNSNLSYDEQFVSCVQKYIKDKDKLCCNILDEVVCFNTKRSNMKYKIERIKEISLQIEKQRTQLGAMKSLYALDSLEDDIDDFKYVDVCMEKLSHCLCLSFESIRDELRKTYIKDLIV
jgi:hypothetical protein